MMEYETIVTRLTVVPKGKPVYCEEAVEINLEDECAGAFFVLSGGSANGVAIDSEQWPELKKSIEWMDTTCLAYNLSREK